MNLSEIRPGVSCKVLAFDGPSTLVERLREMGLHKGVEISLLQRSPFSGPLVFSISNTMIALRAQEAACVLVQVDS